jgi:hypothetical protein
MGVELIPTTGLRRSKNRWVSLTPVLYTPFCGEAIRDGALKLPIAVFSPFLE